MELSYDPVTFVEGFLPAQMAQLLPEHTQVIGALRAQMLRDAHAADRTSNPLQALSQLVDRYAPAIDAKIGPQRYQWALRQCTAYWAAVRDVAILEGSRSVKIVE